MKRIAAAIGTLAALVALAGRADAHSSSVTCSGATNDFTTTAVVSYRSVDGAQVATATVPAAAAGQLGRVTFTPPASAVGYVVTWADGFRVPNGPGFNVLPGAPCQAPATTTTVPATTISPTTTAATTTTSSSVATTVGPTSTVPPTSTSRPTVPTSLIPGPEPCSTPNCWVTTTTVQSAESLCQANVFGCPTTTTVDDTATSIAQLAATGAAGVAKAAVVAALLLAAGLLLVYAASTLRAARRLLRATAARLDAMEDDAR